MGNLAGMRSSAWNENGGAWLRLHFTYVGLAKQWLFTRHELAGDPNQCHGDQ